MTEDVQSSISLQILTSRSIEKRQIKIGLKKWMKHEANVGCSFGWTLINKSVNISCYWSIKLLMWVEMWFLTRRSILIKALHKLQTQDQNFLRECYKFCIKFKYLLLNQHQNTKEPWKYIVTLIPQVQATPLEFPRSIKQMLIRLIRNQK